MVKSSWEPVANWYGEHLEEGGKFQHTLVFPGALRLLAPKSGRTYLDVACGEGTFVAMIAKSKSLVTGVDASVSLVKQAQAKKIDGTKFLAGDAARLDDVLGKAVFDGASCILALQNIEKLQPTIEGVAKHLKSGASFVIVMNHPAFRIPRQSSWGFDEGKKMQYRRVDAYMSENAIPMQVHPSQKSSATTMAYHRPLSAYFAALSKAGFVIDTLEEWTSDKTSDSGSRAKAENRSRNEIPLFMAIRARKS